MSSDTDVRLARWKSEVGRARYIEAYRAAQALWEAPVEDRFIPTWFDTTHALVSGDPTSQPVFLLHAAFNTGGIQWYPNVAALSQHRL